MYARVIPLLKLSRQIETFDYTIPEKLEGKVKAGQLVTIPFRNQRKQGIIISIEKKNCSRNLKEILGIEDRKEFLYKEQLDLIQWGAFYYCTSPALFVKMIIPKIPQKREILEQPSNNLLLKKLSIAKSDLPEVKKILDTIEKENKVLFFWQNYKNKIAVFLKLLEKFSDSQQVILIFPEIGQIEEFTSYIPLKFHQRLSILHSKLSLKSYWQNWDKIRNSKNGIIIGSRQAIFSPVSNLGMIIIDDEHNTSHKQWDQNPRYHSLETAKELQSITKAKLLIASSAPSIETYYNAQNSNYKIIIEGGNQSSPIKIIKMQDEWKNHNNSIFSREAIEMLGINIEGKKRSIIYLNRKGIAKFIICKDCGYIPQCPKCHLPLPLSKVSDASKKIKKILSCPHCNYCEDIPPFCLKCKNVEFKYAGTGIEKIKEELIKFFPKANIERIDSTTKDLTIKSAIEEFQNKKLDILIGTKTILNPKLILNIDLVLVLNIDTELQISSFKAAENCLQTLNYFKPMLAKGGKIIAQTYSNDNKFIELLGRGFDYKNFIQDELFYRKKLNYPPFSQLIKLTYRHKNSKIIFAETKKISSLMENYCNVNKNICVLDNINLPMRFGKYGVEIIIKNNSHKSSLQEWLIKNIPSEWIIDIDPIEI